VRGTTNLQQLRRQKLCSQTRRWHRWIFWQCIRCAQLLYRWSDDCYVTSDKPADTRALRNNRRLLLTSSLQDFSDQMIIAWVNQWTWSWHVPGSSPLDNFSAFFTWCRTFSPSTTTIRRPTLLKRPSVDVFKSDRGRSVRVRNTG